MKLHSLAALLLALPAVAGAQVAPAPQGPDRATISIALAIAQPLGEFRDYVKIGAGLDGSLVWHLSADRAWGLRFDGGFRERGEIHDANDRGYRGRKRTRKIIGE